VEEMQIANPLQINDWEIKKFIRIVLAIQLALWGSIGLDALGIQVPIVRQLVGFLYLTFVPGIILLRILKMHNIGNVETILYTVGLSIATIMFTGAFMNAVFPSLGISGPISNTSLVITIGAVISVLCAICYIRDRDFRDPDFIDLKDVLSPAVLFLGLIPFLAIFGTYAANYYNINSILIIMLILISVLSVLIAFDLFICRKMFPLAVLMIAISLVFHNSLISMYVWGYDINIELYLANLVKTYSIWDPTLPSNSNGMLSIVMLAPIYSIISDLSLTWVFKIIYPLLFSLVPLGLYRVFQKQTDDRIAFVSCLFFMSLSVFYTELLQLARQQIAELFLVLLILLMISKNINRSRRSFLIIIFSIALAVSHYGLSYIFMLCLIVAWIMLVLAENPKIHELVNSILSNFGIANKEQVLDSNQVKSDRSINSAFVLFFVIFTLAWYIFVSNSSAFESIARIGSHMMRSISTSFLDPDSAEGLKLITAQSAPGLLHDINKAMNYLNQIFIIIGGIVLFLRFRAFRFEREYIALSELNLGLCFAGVSVPFFASALNMARLYQITLILLALLCVIGGMAVIRGIINMVGISWTDRHMSISIKILSIYFALFLLYQTGLIFELTEGSSSLNSLNRNNDREVSGAVWLSLVKGSEKVYADLSRRPLLYGIMRLDQSDYFQTYPDKDFERSYKYLGTFNIMDKSVLLFHSQVDYSSVINGRDKIYDNSGAWMFYR
jgi:uncharacterized membrane protein